MCCVVVVICRIGRYQENILHQHVHCRQIWCVHCMFMFLTSLLWQIWCVQCMFMLLYSLQVHQKLDVLMYTPSQVLVALGEVHVQMIYGMFGSLSWLASPLSYATCHNYLRQCSSFPYCMCNRILVQPQARHGYPRQGTKQLCLQTTLSRAASGGSPGLDYSDGAADAISCPIRLSQIIWPLSL